MSKTPYLDRYLAGDHIRVWQELAQIPPRVLYESPLFTDVYAVAQETMRRVRSNLETLKQRWEDAGLEFEYPDDEVLGGPARISDLDELVLNHRDRIGQFPISLQAFWETVGHVNFCAQDNKFIDPRTGDSYDGSDPLWVYPAPTILSDVQQWDEHDEWKIMRYPFLREGIPITFAPDIYHKDDYSGGGGLEFILIAGTDCQITSSAYTQGDETISLIDYLRLAIKWAGFPGFSRYGKPQPKYYKDKTAPAIVLEMACDLLPF